MSINDLDRLADLCSKAHKDQAVWFLNGFWDEFGNEAENLWKYVAKFVEIDEAKRAEGNSIDEFGAHRFLEFFHETLTVHAMRDKLRSVGAIGATDRPKVVPLTHFLLWKYNIDWHALVNAPQGSKEEIEKARRMLEQVQAAFAECERRDQEASAALRESKAKENEAVARESDARAREAELKAAKAELEAALAELKAQEDAYNNRTADLTRQSESGASMVAKNRAKNELAQHLSEDPLPLRRAKITQEAAVKKAERAAKAAEDASREASAARAEAEQSRRRSEQAKAAAEEALEEASNKVAEAEAYLEEAKNKGVPQGHIWWLERELHEAKAYLPASKGGYKKEK